MGTSMTSLMITCVLFQNECEPSEWCLRNGVYGLDAVTPQFKLFCNVTTCLPNMADDCFNMVRAFHLKFSVTDVVMKVIKRTVDQLHSHYVTYSYIRREDLSWPACRCCAKRSRRICQERVNCRSQKCYTLQ